MSSALPGVEIACGHAQEVGDAQLRVRAGAAAGPGAALARCGPIVDRPLHDAGRRRGAGRTAGTGEAVRVLGLVAWAIAPKTTFRPRSDPAVRSRRVSLDAPDERLERLLAVILGDALQRCDPGARQGVVTVADRGGGAGGPDAVGAIV